MFFQKQEPVIVWDGGSAQRQLAALESVRQSLPAKERLKAEQEIKMIAAGIAGERQIMFELQNSHLSLCILHDLHLKLGELEAQIDYLVVTPKRTFVLECKNLIGDIEITNKGEFIRSTSYGGRNKRE